MVYMELIWAKLIGFGSEESRMDDHSEKGLIAEVNSGRQQCRQQRDCQY